MILADKITALRKKAGWSQEELAEQLGVTRQSVSKWEGAQSVPDMDKVVQMSRLFGVTTDFLLKDELSEEEPAPEGCDSPLRRAALRRHVRHRRLPLLHLRPHGQRTAEIQLVHLGGRGRALRRGHAGGKAHRKEKVTAARYIEKCPFSERTDIFCVFAYRHSAQ